MKRTDVLQHIAALRNGDSDDHQSRFGELSGRPSER